LKVPEITLTYKTWPTLYTKGKNGELRAWQVATIGDTIIVNHGVKGGAIVKAERKATPKNVGRSNETTGEQQADLEAAAMHKFKLDRKYSLTPEEAQDVVPLPMLAKDFKKAKNIQYPVDVQPKLDGVRAIARWEGDRVVLISRGGKTWTAVPHINKALESILPKDSEFDGELYVHGKPFQWITSRAKKAHDDSGEIQYHVYDFPTINGDDSLTWQERREAAAMLPNAQERWKHFEKTDDGGIREVFVRVLTYTAKDAEEVKFYHDAFVQNGYEGAIVRLLDGMYEYGHRSGSLLKLKQFDDHEYKIVGHTNGEGIESDLVIWICEDSDGKQFATRPKGTHDDRRWLLQHATEFYGQMLKVKHFGFTDDGLPRFPIAEGIRVEEDLD
jgi:ATP-dependent DNA ligase